MAGPTTVFLDHATQMAHDEVSKITTWNAGTYLISQMIMPDGRPVHIGRVNNGYRDRQFLLSGRLAEIIEHNPERTKKADALFELINDAGFIEVISFNGALEAVPAGAWMKQTSSEIEAELRKAASFIDELRQSIARFEEKTIIRPKAKIFPPGGVLRGLVN